MLPPDSSFLYKILHDLLQIVNSIMHKHSIPETEKAIPLPNGFLIGRQYLLSPRQRTNQHHQRRFWQMKIGDQAIQHFEAITRVDKNFRIPTARLDHACTVSSTLQGATTGGAHTDDSPPAALTALI